MEDIMDIKNLIFGGGGAAGIAYAGAVYQLSIEPEFSILNVERVAGASIGSIAALLISLNYSPLEASEKIANLNLGKLKDGGWFFSQMYRLITEYGKYRGDALFEFIKSIIREKIDRKDPENVTFAELRELGFKDLHIVATKLYKENDVPTGKQKVFSADKTPNTSVAAAIRASIAAPTYFARVRLKKVEKGKHVLDPKGDLYEDGGVLNNFPIDLFDTPKYFGRPDNEAVSIVNMHTLGFALRHTYQINDQEHKPIKTPIYDSHPFEFAEGMINGLLNQRENEKLDKAINRERTIQIDRQGVNLANFDIDEKTKIALIEAGKDAVKRYFDDARELAKKKQIATFADKPVPVGKLWEPMLNIARAAMEDKNVTRKYGCAVM